MGASAWLYIVPHQPDVAAALDALRWDVFRSGEYVRGYASAASAKLPSFEEWCASLPPDYLADMGDDARDEYDALARQIGLVPKTPDEAVEKAGEDGTHSILDVTKVTAVPRFGAVCPMPDEERIALFGSARPTRTAVESARHRIDPPKGRGSGWWLEVYADDDGERPRWLCFAGVSGD